jgi:N-methylhydantoinase B
MTLDSTNLQVLANYCAAAAESMGWTLMRTAYSTFVKETEDFSCQVMTPAGLTVASPLSFGATWFTGLDYGGVIGQFDYREGDIYLTSDPYAGNVATHTPDIHVWRPVMRDGQLVCFVGNHVHNTDVGGAVPATLSRSLTEIQQEGLRIPPMRLMRDGVLNRDLLRMIANNVRLPEQNRGDLNAQIACVTVGERKVHEIIDRFGRKTFSEGLDGLLDYADRQAREVIRGIPDGEYFFADYADEDQTGGYPVRVAVTLRIHGDTLTVDYTGSDPQLASSLNMPTGGKERHALVMVGVVYALYCLDPSITLNAGLVRPARAILPPGSHHERGHARRRRHAQPDLQSGADGGDRRLLSRPAGPHARQPGQRVECDEREDHDANRARRHGQHWPGRRRRRRWTDGGRRGRLRRQHVVP